MPVEVKLTIVEGTSIAEPVWLMAVVEAVKRSGGATVKVTVTERAIEAAVLELAGSGLYAEPTSTAAAAAHSRLVASGAISPSESAVVILTGSGLKATQVTEKLVSR